MADWGDYGLQKGHPLDAFLGGKLSGMGQSFQDSGSKYGVDPVLLASIATFESGHGTSNFTKKYNNPMGMMDPESKNQSQPIKYDSIPAAIDDAARNLKQNYIDKGLTTIPAIAQEYSPPTDPKTGKPVPNDVMGTNWEWPVTVQKLYTQMGGTREDFGPPKIALMN